MKFSEFSCIKCVCWEESHQSSCRPGYFDVGQCKFNPPTADLERISKDIHKMDPLNIYPEVWDNDRCYQGFLITRPRKTKGV